MSVRIRLRRMGAKKNPFYRIVVVDSRNPRDGRYIESLGSYDPTSESLSVEIDEEKLFEWLNHGAQPSDPVWSLLNRLGLRKKWEMVKRGEDLSTWQPPQPRESKIKKKAKVAAAAAKPEQPVAVEEEAVRPSAEKAQVTEVSKTAEKDTEKAQPAEETKKEAQEKEHKRSAEHKEKKKATKKAAEPKAEKSAEGEQAAEGKHSTSEISSKKKTTADS